MGRLDIIMDTNLTEIVVSTAVTIGYGMYILAPAIHKHRGPGLPVLMVVQFLAFGALHVLLLLAFGNALANAVSLSAVATVIATAMGISTYRYFQRD